MKAFSFGLIFYLFSFGFIIANSEKQMHNKNEVINQVNDSLKILNKSELKQQIITSLTFQKNDAEKAMNLYVSLFENSRIIAVQRWGKEAPGKEGSIMMAVFELNGQKFMCSDSPPIHNWDFTPAVSNFVECKDEKELQRLFSKLSENGNVTMPINNYGFSQKFAWVIDQFGVSWQLNLQ